MPEGSDLTESGASGTSASTPGTPDARARPAPRIPPRPAADWDTQAQEVLGKWRGTGAGTGDMPRIFSTLAHYPKLLAAWEPFAGTILLDGLLPGRERELLVMRTALNCRASYIWGQHITDHGPECGVTEEEVAMVVEGPDAPGWDPFDAALIAAADQLHHDSRIDDETWATLASRYDERQLIEVTMLVGEYHLMAFAANSLGVQDEDGIPGLPEGWKR